MVQRLGWKKLTIAAMLAATAGFAYFGVTRIRAQHVRPSEASSQQRKGLPQYIPSAAEWAALTVEPVSEQVFRGEHVTEGKIAVNEDSSTPIFSPYAGRVIKLLAKPSDVVERGQPLFVVEATDTVQGLNDFIAALGAVNKARSTSQSGADRGKAG